MHAWAIHTSSPRHTQPWEGLWISVSLSHPCKVNPLCAPPSPADFHWSVSKELGLSTWLGASGAESPRSCFRESPSNKPIFVFKGKKKGVILGWLECHSKQLCTTTLRKGIPGAQIALKRLWIPLAYQSLRLPCRKLVGSFRKRAPSIKRRDQFRVWRFQGVLRLQPPSGSGCSSENTPSNANTFWGMLELSKAVCEHTHCTYSRQPQELPPGPGIFACYAGSLEKCVYVLPTPILPDWCLSASL